MRKKCLQCFMHTHSMSMFGIQTDKPVNRECVESFFFALLVFDDHIKRDDYFA